MKSIDKITFDDNLLDDYQNEIDRINKKIDQLNHDKSFQKLYKKYLETKNNIEVHYNKINNRLNDYKKINTIRFNLKNDKIINSSQFQGKFC